MSRNALCGMRYGSVFKIVVSKTYINILPVLIKYFFFVVVLYFRSGSHVMEKLFQGENISYCHADGEGLLIIVTS